MSDDEEMDRGASEEEPIDVDALMADIRRRVERKKAQGLYSVDELAADSLDTTEPLGADELERLRPMAAVQVDLSVSASDKPMVGKAISPLKRRLVRGVSQPLFGVASQTGRFNAGLLAYAAQLGRETAALRGELESAEARSEEARQRSAQLASELASAQESLDVLSWRLGRIEAAALPSRVTRLEDGGAGVQLQISVEQTSHGATGRLGVILEARDGVEHDLEWTGLASSAEAPVLHVGCGSGRALERLGPGAIGLEPDPELAAAARREKRAVTAADPIEHVSGLTPGTLGGALVTTLTERLDGRSLFALLSGLARALQENAPIVVAAARPDEEAAGGAGWRDPLRMRPFHPDALLALADAAGLEERVIEDAPPGPGGEARYCLRARG